MSPENAMHAEWECVKVLTYFFNSLDDRRFADLAACMTETGVWVRQGKPLEGRSAILSALAERSSTVSTRHLISNPEVKFKDEVAEVAAVVTIFHHDDGNGTQPAPIAPPRAILRFTAVMTSSGANWQISQLKSDRLFVH